MSPPICQIIDLGTIDYRQAWAMQIQLAQAVHDGQQTDTLLLLEHPHVYTKGRLSQDEHLLLTPAQLAERGIDLVETDRGGQITYHGPGQLVAYPVVNLRDWGGPLKYLRTLEQILLQTLKDFGIDAGLVAGLTGVWLADRKIAAIGVKISRGVAHHGFAINVNTDLSYFEHIVPCGITDRQVTSMQEILGEPVDLDAVKRSVAHHVGQGMGYNMVAGESSLLARCLTI